MKDLYLACSDDRTVRVWNVANLVSDVEDDSSITIQGDRENLDKVQTGFGNTIDSTNLLPSHGQCIAKEWGHSSRIWGVRSLFGTTINDLKGFSTNLISYGEDAQSQLWKFSVKSAMIAGSKIGENINKLEHIGTFRAHSGKNIWSMAVDYDKSDSTNNLATGGADGQISISQVHQSIPSRTKTIDCELALSNILESLPTSASDFSTLSNLSCIDTDSFHGYFALQDGGYLIVTRGGRLITGSCPALSSASAEPDFKETGFDLRDLGSPIVKSNYCRLSNSLFAVCEDQKLYHLQMGSPCIRTMGISNFHAARIFLCALPNESFSAKVEEHNLTQRYGGASPMTKEAGNLVLITYFKTNIVDLYVSVDRSSTHKTPKISISLDPTFVLTSAVFTPFGCKLVLGSRAGTLAYYRIHGLSSRNSAENLSLSLVDFDKFHKDSINKIIDLSLFEAKGCILTVSEDGTYAIHRHGQSGEWSEGFEKYRPLEKSNNAPMAPRTASGRLLHSSSPKCLSAIKNAYFDKTSGSLMLVGFCTNDFIVWNETLQVEHMRHHMRGGIKGSFAFHETGIGSLREKTLVYTQNSKHRVVISKGESQKVLQQANFGRDLKALAVRPISPRGDLGATALSPGSIMFACGSEECNIHLVEYLDEVIRNVRTVKKHDAGIQHLKWSNDGRFLFSCGGQGELKIWEYHPVPVLEHGLVLVAELNVKTGGHPADVRIMAFDIKREMDPHIADSWFVITLVTSTSLIEVWNYTPINNTLARLFQTTYTSCALTQVTTIKLDSIRLILVAATDGHITAYRAPSKESRESTTIDFHQPLASLRVHQSAIKALEIHPLDQHRYLIFTAGDDNALHACILSIVPQSECRVAIQDLECNSNAHAAAINGLAIIHAFSPSEGRVVGFLATTGNDGLVKIWRWGYPANEIQSKERKTFLTCCGQLNSDVADATAMDHVTFNERVFIFVSGVGMEILSVQQQDLM
ncbi:MAG: hypothetical protein M1814_002136 [Vezdaea aestivalis]|nr:MAG: hypothetical protein M1814_002136 [Vezdaea aestivalis]